MGGVGDSVTAGLDCPIDPTTQPPITRSPNHQILMPALVRVGVLGAGAWARGAHLPGYRRDPRCTVVAIADTEIDRARDAAREFDIPVAVADARELVRRDDIDLIDVCTPSHTHFELAWS